MASYRVLFATFLLFQLSNSAVFLWGPEIVQTPALKQFDNDVLKDILHQIDDSRLVAFNGKSKNVAKMINKMLSNVTTSYLPSSKLIIDDVIELTGDQADDFNIVQDILKNGANNPQSTVIALITKDEERVKRKAENISNAIPEEAEMPYSEPERGPVLYSAASPTDENLEAMIYSSKPPQLKVNSTIIYLGKALVNKMDVRDSYTRLIATISTGSGKISLRFKFHWRAGYWYLNSVEVEFVDPQMKQYNLTLNQEVTAPRRFSYHCGGSVFFGDPENDNVQLQLFDVQAQPDAFKHRFSDNYSCVPIITIPIFSGLFMVFILMIGLALGLYALKEIKCPDRFESLKSRPYTAVVWE